jgi:hypothetical protein
MRLIFIIFILCSCFGSKPSNEIEGLGEEVLKRKEGIDIRMVPIEEIKDKK